MGSLKKGALALVVMIGVLSPAIHAQINLKTGYHVNYLNDPGLDILVDEINQVKAYSDKVPQLWWMHGIEAGLRLKTDIHAFEITYQAAYQSLKGRGPSPDGNGNYRDLYRFGIHSAGIGYQISGPKFGMGVDYLFQWYRTKVNLASTDIDFVNVQDMKGVNVYALFYFSGSQGVDMALRPFVVLPLDTRDHDPLRTYLGLQGQEEKYKWNRFGVSVMFYNGG